MTKLVGPKKVPIYMTRCGDCLHLRKVNEKGDHACTPSGNYWFDHERVSPEFATFCIHFTKK